MLLINVVRSLGLLLAAPAVHASVGYAPSSGQEPFLNAFQSYDDGLFRPYEDLDALSTAEFTNLGHPLFPNYNVRVKKTDFCDGTVRAFTGYIDIEARHLFFYFFESRGDPSKDDVIFWTNGGPGCSSSLGLFMELGPCRINTPDNTTFNPYSWNEHANIFFIDQPIGVGFSYAEHGETVSTSEEGAKDIAAFVAIFFEHFSQFKGRGFHMAGESYGGRYVPTYAAAVYDQNAKLIEAGATPINISSIMVGNGCTDWESMLLSYHDMACQARSVVPGTSISTCVAAKQTVARCQKWVSESCFERMDAISCEAAYGWCEGALSRPMDAANLNPYDMSRVCDGNIAETLCYPVTKNITRFLNRHDIRQLIGVDPSLTANFSSCNDDVNRRFGQTLDGMFPAQYYIAALLERGVRALIYVGDYDWICNWVGNERMTLALEWTGQAAFNEQPLRDWTIGDHAAGVTRSAGPLTFATIAKAGHMAPYDKPKESLELVRRWLAGEEL